MRNPFRIYGMCAEMSRNNRLNYITCFGFIDCCPKILNQLKIKIKLTCVGHVS